MSDISSASQLLINEFNEHSIKLINQKSSSANNTVKRKRKSINSKINDKNPLDFFWNIVGRHNYTISLNQSPVLCNSFSADPQDFFGSFTSNFNYFDSLPWRSRRFSQRVVPTMVPNKDDSTISLLTKTIKSGASFLASSSYTSTIKGDWENTTVPNIPMTPPREESHLSLYHQEMSQPIELIGRHDDTEPVLNKEIAEQVL